MPSASERLSVTIVPAFVLFVICLVFGIIGLVSCNAYSDGTVSRIDPLEYDKCRLHVSYNVSTHTHETDIERQCVFGNPSHYIPVCYNRLSHSKVDKGYFPFALGIVFISAAIFLFVFMTGVWICMCVGPSDFRRFRDSSESRQSEAPQHRIVSVL